MREPPLAGARRPPATPRDSPMHSASCGARGAGRYDPAAADRIEGEAVLDVAMLQNGADAVTLDLGTALDGTAAARPDPPASKRG